MIRPLCRLTLAAALGGMVASAGPVATFGPGRVSCQQLVGEHVDCLLSTFRITGNNRNESSFDITVLPPDEQMDFRKWCSHDADECTTTVTGTTESPDSNRLSRVTSLRWRRHDPPVDQAAARAIRSAGCPRC